MPRLTQEQIDIATEIGPDGHRIGRDPRQMSRDELRKMGHEPKSPLSALRDHCLDCCAGSAGEVRMCMALRCPSWPDRMGTNPWRRSASEAQRAQGRKLGARRRQKSAEALPLNGSENGEATVGIGVGAPQRRDETI
jgi:hypothetical protein